MFHSIISAALGNGVSPLETAEAESTGSENQQKSSIIINLLLHKHI
jgi:hypothetical protein